MAPIVQGWAVIGRRDNFFLPCALDSAPGYREDSLRFRVKESGPVVIWRGKGPVKAGNTPSEIWGTGFMNCNSPSPTAPGRYCNNGIIPHISSHFSLLHFP